MLVGLLIELIIIYASICAVIYSVFLALDGSEERLAPLKKKLIKYNPKFNLLFILSIGLASIVGFFLIIFNISNAYKNESIILPWSVIFDFNGSDTIFHHSYRATGSILFSLWAFLIPARIYTVETARDSGKILAWPYIVNILIGLLLSTPKNPLVGAFLWWGHTFGDMPYPDGR